ncbi:kinase-like domain-containing protein [Powellomyces hirtus]|nr:kinase-like domain-containing protein [Powellomyces hirtus]
MIVREVGRGCHGKVKLCVDTETGEEWALKIVPKKSRPRFQSRLHSGRSGHPSTGGQPVNPELEKIMREIAILKKCKHPHVVGLREVIDDPASEKIYLVLEYLAGGDIKWQNREDPESPLLSVDAARGIFQDVVCGVEYLHYQGIVHRDIKPANLLWTTEGRVKISDFGVSVVVHPELSPEHPNLPDDAGRTHELELAKTAGTPAFFAPEMCGPADDESVSNLPSDAPIGKAIDIWAMGVTLYCLVFGRVPFIAESEYELFNVISRKQLEFPANHPIDEDLQDLLQKLLDKNPLTRITLEGIKV